MLDGCITIRATGQQQHFAELNEQAVAIMQQTAIAGMPFSLSFGA